MRLAAVRFGSEDVQALSDGNFRVERADSRRVPERAACNEGDVSDCPAVTDWRDGATIREVAQRYGTNYHVVRNTLLAHGVTSEEMAFRRGRSAWIRVRDSNDALAASAWELIGDGLTFSLSELRGPSRNRVIVTVRHRVWREMRALGVPVIAIGRFFRRDHTSVLYALGKGPK